MTERELRNSVSTSRSDGFRALFDQYKSYVYTIVWNQLRAVGTPQDAEECVSDVFLQVFLHFEEIRDGSLQAYIGTVARHRAIDAARALHIRNNRTDESVDCTDIPSDENVEQETDAAMEYAHLYQKIRELGEPDCTILVLKYFYRMTSGHIAEQLHITPIAVRVRLNRAKAKLRRLLTEDETFR